MIAPCQGCEERYSGCHVLCPEYADFRERRALAREFLRQGRNDDATQLKIEGILREKNEKRRAPAATGNAA